MSGPEKWLRFLLRLGAIVLMTATFAVLLPHSWMDQGHQALQLGTLPELPLIGYLTRSIAALYAYHGVMIWVIANDLRHYRKMIPVIGYGDTIFGIAMTGIDWCVGMPWFWTISEGPSLIVFGLIILWLWKKCEKQWAEIT
jgi:hypothetical protein